MESVKFTIFSFETVSFPAFFNLKVVKNIKRPTFLFKIVYKDAFYIKLSSLKSDFGLANTSHGRYSLLCTQSLQIILRVVCIVLLKP